MREISLGLFFAIALAGQAPEASPPNFVSAKLETSAETASNLRGSFLLTADGPASLAYRDAYLSATPAPSVALFGPYLRRSQIRLNPSVSSAVDPANPIRIHYAFLDESFIFPILRQAALRFELLPPPPESMPPGVWREEVTFKIPADFEIHAKFQFDDDRPFARYRSNASVESGQLRIVRELEVKAGARSLEDAASFWKWVRDDQQRSFLLRRTVKADVSAWIESVPAAQANSLGVRAQQQREFDTARRLFEKVVTAQPKDRFAWNNLGRALASLGRLEEARAAYQKQIEVNPADAYAYNNLGLIYERLGNWGQAVESLQKQLQVHPGDQYATQNLPRALIHERRWKEAQDAAQAALQAQRGNTLQKVNLEVARICEGGHDDSLSAIDAAMGAKPSTGILNNAAYYLTECGQHYELAESYIKRAISNVQSAVHGRISSAVAFQTSLSTYVDTYGWLLYKQGHADRAITVLTASARLARRGEVYGHLAEVESKLGHTQEALRYWKQATAIEPGLLAQVPSEFAPQLASIASLSDGEWSPLAAKLPATGSAEPLYYFVVAKPDGKVESARALAADDPAAKTLEPAVASLAFPVVQIEESPMPTVHFVRISTGGDGVTMAAESVGAEALAIANDLLPAEFPAPPAAARPASTGAALPIGPGITPPSVVSKVAPNYSEKARKARLEGTVVVRGVVYTDGTARDFQVMRSLGSGLDEEAIAAVSKWRFRPGTKDGSPVNVFVTIEVNFRLREK